MNIVVLDGFTLNPGDLSWDELKTLGHCEIFDRTPDSEVMSRSAHAEVLLTNKTQLKRTNIHSLPKLKYVGVLATGTNCVDLAAARERHIPVTNVPTYGTKSVAQMTTALLLELAQNVGHHAQTVRDGCWARSLDWCYWNRPLIELDGLAMGIVGFGRIGRTVGQLAAAFGMKVYAYDSIPPIVPPDVHVMSLETLFRESDVVSLHCPLTEATRHLVNAKRLSWMKATSLLLNTSRGPLIDEHALADALNLGSIAGAALDVLSVEPPRPDNPLLSAKNCIITPHIAWATRAARSRLMTIAVENVRAFFESNPQNLVN